MDELTIYLATTLEQIAALGGNLPDKRLTDKTGANDAVQRGLMYVHARKLATIALGKVAEYNGFAVVVVQGASDE